MKSLRTRRKVENGLLSVAIQSHANRGRSLETMLNMTNSQYRRNNWALVDKIPTPIKKLRDYSRGTFIAVWESKSSVDYQGVYNGRALVFEAKMCREEKRFPLANIHDHQIAYLEQAEQQGAITFLIIDFSKLDEVYLVPGQYVVKYWHNAQAGERKSIPIEAIRELGMRVRTGRGVILDYLAVVDKLWKRVG
ncbi:Holliday junction resolvase RecU [Alicyclobacillus fastidiosus]|uniref:Holliday junction resolvase RecU n=1 Tax=Alicyclobacillus fastidiosus TaxID=392011 RepID=A0ABV5AKV2_9BACL|nr:Holliday junction resolvase RecU [Alicyclobacillus fastidiosus]WEH09283.1 Holliday junction resolvase RecU [Alicyclobacillus fastidiosus]